MNPDLRRRPWPTRVPTPPPGILAAAVLGLLVLLATLQFRWTGELSRAERERSQAGLETSLDLLARDFDRQLSGLFLAFQASFINGDANSLVRAFEGWEAQSRHPDLVREVFEIRLEGDRPTLQRFDLAARDWVEWPEPWPEAIDSMWHRVRQRHLSRSPSRGNPFDPVDAAAPALLLPDPQMFRRGPPRGADDGDQQTAPLRLRIVWLDREALVDRLLSELVDQYFTDADGQLIYRLEVFDRDGRNIFGVGPAPEGAQDKAMGDANVEFFGLGRDGGPRDRPLPRPPDRVDPGPFQDRDGRGPRDRDGRAERSRGDRGREGLRDRMRRRFVSERMLSGFSPEKHWIAVATHPAGSLDIAVERVRRRNLAVSFGILGLLAASGGLLLVSTRRAQRLAKAQIELVAGVTHELMTPLAALRAAGQNLADGVVSESTQVVRYGKLVDREGNRLAEMVAQMLELAGIQSGQRSFERRPVDMASLVSAEVEDLRPELEGQGVTIELDAADGLPPVLGDAEALGRAVRNLLSNVLKYAAGGGWMGVTVHDRGDTVEIQVADRGPGIDPEDLPHIFESFRRGRGVAASNVPGSGLGLGLVKSIVEHHGGRVAVSQPNTGGSVFGFWLPVDRGRP